MHYMLFNPMYAVEVSMQYKWTHYMLLKNVHAVQIARQYMVHAVEMPHVVHCRGC